MTRFAERETASSLKNGNISKHKKSNTPFFPVVEEQTLYGYRRQISYFEEYVGHSRNPTLTYLAAALAERFLKMEEVEVKLSPSDQLSDQRLGSELCGRGKGATGGCINNRKCANLLVSTSTRSVSADAKKRFSKEVVEINEVRLTCRPLYK
jgi:hypothetical protein